MMAAAGRPPPRRPPRPDLSVKMGTPNACTGCHRDRTPEWAAATIVKWYGPERPKGLEWPLAVAAGRGGARGAAPPLAGVAGGRGNPPIVRAPPPRPLRGYGSPGTHAPIPALGGGDP